MRTSKRTNRRLLAFVVILTVSLVCPSTGLAGKRKRKSKTDELVAEYAQAFRVQVYETFHDDREEYDWRIKKGKEAVKLYKTLEEPAKQQVIVGWFQLAMETSRPDANTRLPNIPNLDFFGKSDKVAENSDSAGSEKQLPLESAPRPQDSSGHALDEVKNHGFDSMAGPDPLESFVNSELQSGTDASDEELMPVQPKPEMVEAPQAEIENNDELIGFGDEELTASSGLPSLDSDSLNASDDEGGLDFEELDAPEQEPVMASSDRGSTDNQGISNDKDASDDWADVAVAGVVKSTNGNGFPGVLETNARIAGLNLALQGIEAQSKVAFNESPEMASEIAKKLQMLAESNRQIQNLVSMAPAKERANLIKLAPFNESANRFLMQFRAVGSNEMGISNNERLKLIGTLEEFAR